jgi:flavodoxin
MANMRALVVYESMFGNTEQVAKEIMTGLASYGDARLLEVGDAPPDVAGYDLVVVGGPTHAFSMSRPSTRQDAVRQGADHGASRGIREWLSELPAGTVGVATFDTRVDKVRRLPGSAARRAAKVLGRLGYRLLAGPESFYVDDTAGPLLPGEPDRASDWAMALGGRAGSAVS